MSPEDFRLHSRTERYNKIYKAVNDVIDMPAQELWVLVDSAERNDGILSTEIRAKLSASGYGPQVAIAQDAIARVYQQELEPDERDDPVPSSDRLYRAVSLEYPQRSDATVALVIERGQWQDWFSLRLALQKEPQLWRRESVEEKYRSNLCTAAFASHLPAELVQKAGLWIHGHMHALKRYRLGST